MMRAFSALLRIDSRFAQVILGSGRLFYICESTIVELFKHKEKIVRLSKLSEAEVIRLFYTLLRRLTVLKEELIEPAIRQKAYELCSEIDEADTPQVALAMHLNGLLWTGDETKIRAASTRVRCILRARLAGRLKSRLGASGRACPEGHAVCRMHLEKCKSGFSTIALVGEGLQTSRLQPTLPISPGIHSRAAC